jgi:hypothetical protein
MGGNGKQERIKGRELKYCCRNAKWLIFLVFASFTHARINFICI